MENFPSCFISAAQRWRRCWEWEDAPAVLVPVDGRAKVPEGGGQQLGEGSKRLRRVFGLRVYKWRDASSWLLSAVTGHNNQSRYRRSEPLFLTTKGGKSESDTR